MFYHVSELPKSIKKKKLGCASFSFGVWKSEETLFFVFDILRCRYLAFKNPREADQFAIYIAWFTSELKLGNNVLQIQKAIGKEDFKPHYNSSTLNHCNTVSLFWSTKYHGKVLRQLKRLCHHSSVTLKKVKRFIYINGNPNIVVQFC